MTLRKVVAGWLAVVLVPVGSWALGCTAIVGADDYKVGQAAPACVAEEGDCTSATCCSNLCLTRTIGNASHNVCGKLCQSAADCASHCCEALDMETRMACAPRGFCADTCVKAGIACNDPGDCCGDSACINDGMTQLCHFICKTNDECQSKCCVQVEGMDFTVCADPKFCTMKP